MKKKLLILISIILSSLLLIMLIFTNNGKNKWNLAVNDFLNSEEITVIYNNGLYKFYNDEEIKNLEYVKNENISFQQVKEDQESFRNKIEEIINILNKLEVKPVRKITNDGSVLIGFTNEKNKNYLYIYDNGTAIININNKYYVYKIKDDLLINKLSDLKNTGDPYFSYN